MHLPLRVVLGSMAIRKLKLVPRDVFSWLVDTLLLPFDTTSYVPHTHTFCSGRHLCLLPMCTRGTHNRRRSVHVFRRLVGSRTGLLSLKSFVH
jgi:hypothetical protein